MSKEQPPYRTVSLKTEFADSLEQFIRANPQYGYRSLAQFLEDSGRRRLEELEGKEPPRMVRVNADNEGAKIFDYQLRRLVEISFKRTGVHCNVDESPDCEHIRFALGQSDIRRILKQKKAQGWNVPDV